MFKVQLSMTHLPQFVLKVSNARVSPASLCWRHCRLTIGLKIYSLLISPCYN